MISKNSESEAFHFSNNNAYRIRVAISLTGLKTFDFAKKSGIPKQTLWTWETGKIDLKQKAAIRLSEALSRFNVECSPTWLLTGQGEPPKVIEDAPNGILQNACELDREEISVVKEIAYFRSLNPNNIVVGIRDNSMSPFYKNGDYVGGINIPILDIKKAYNENCIVTLNEGETLVRKLVKGEAKNGYILCTPHEEFSKSLVLADVEIQSVAVVVWHRRCLMI